jgi:predicted MPP superfamily phosphohydrolase
MRRPVVLLTLLHLLVAWRLAAALPAPAAAAVVALLALSAWLIPAGFTHRRGGSRSTADRWTWAGMTALGLFSMLLVLTLLREAALLAAWAFGARDAWLAPTAAAVPLLALAATALGFANARRVPRVRHVDVPLAGLPAALHGFTVAQISDLHVGPTVKAGWVRAVVERANTIGADLVALTGDLVDGRVQDLAADVAPLAGLRSRHGSFFVTGNHEYYSGAAEWIGQARALGMRVLLDEHVVVDHGGEDVVVAGVADYTARHFDPRHRSDPQAALAGAPAGAALRLLLAHQPRSAPAAAAAGFDVQLSGHTHGGQFWPWNLFVPLQQPFVAGLSRLGRLWVYTSRGTGYWGPPLRLGAPAEITALRLVPA